MRITQSETYRNFLSDIENLNEALNRYSRQVSSGKSLTRLTDSPAASAEILSLSDQALEIDQYQSNLDTGSFFLKTADSTLNEVHNLVTSIYALGSQATTVGIGDEGRAVLATEIRALRDQIFSLAGTQVRGRYIFSGTDVLTAPFAMNGDSATYAGNNDVNRIAVDDGLEVPEGVSGAEAFGSVFAAIHTLLTAMDANDTSSIQTALKEFTSALSALGQARGRIGSSLSQLEKVASSLDSREINLKERRSKLEDADLAAAVVQMNQSQNALETALSAGGSILTQRNLFDILG